MKTRAAKFAFMVLIGFVSLAGAATAPVPVAASDDFSQKPFHLDESVSPKPSVKDPEVSAPTEGIGTTKVVISLAGVLGLIFLLRWMMTKVAPGMAGHRDKGAMKVLSRCVVAPRQHLLLIQVGRRLVVVGEAGSQLNALCQITEPDEVSAILQQLSEDRTAAASRFTSIFGRAKKEYDGHDDGDDPENIVMPNRDIAPADSQAAESDVPVDPALDATRQELAGLSDKVRGLARQLGQQS